MSWIRLLPPARKTRRCTHNGGGRLNLLLATPFQPYPQPPEIFRIDCIGKNHQMLRQVSARRLEIQHGQMRSHEAAAKQDGFAPSPGTSLEFAFAIGIEPQCNQRMPQLTEAVTPQSMPGAYENHRQQQGNGPMRQWRQTQHGSGENMHAHEQTCQAPGRSDHYRQRLHQQPL